MSEPLSASYSTTLRVRLQDSPGSFADLARVIADAGFIPRQRTTLYERYVN